MNNLNYPYADDELISALHKTIRASDIPRAAFFAKIIKEKIGVWRVKQYLFFITLEETLSVNLYKEGLKFFLIDDDKITDQDIYKYIYKFCKTKKKWDYKQGQEFYLEHLKSDERFCYNVSNDIEVFDIYDHDFNYNKLQFFEGLVEKSDISFNQKSQTHKKNYLYGYPEMLYLLDKFKKEKNTEKLLELSYLFYLNRDDLDFNLLEYSFQNNKLYQSMKTLDGKYNNIFNYTALFFSLVNDLEDYYINDVDINFISLLEDRINKAIKEKRFLDIPLIALDRHTRRGKHDFAFVDIKYNKPFNVPIDLRYSGMWYGNLWRIESIKQFGKIVDKWEDVTMDKSYEDLWRKHQNSKGAFKNKKLIKNVYHKYTRIPFEFGNILDITEGIIVQQVNCQKVMGAGLALNIKNKYPKVYNDYINMFDVLSKKELLGFVLYSTINEDLVIASTFTQFNYGRNGLYTDYEQLKKALYQLNIYSKKHNKTLYFPYKYASGLAGGNWDAISQLINKYCENYKIIKL